eukprot:GHVN01038448.1.p1 GENE.GHVN01038448.1~~GHVN01038448.1.p1  ORF type:complete len:373 (+),score=153.71 GHVN01038448.1:113-1120(+)
MNQLITHRNPPLVGVVNSSLNTSASGLTQLTSHPPSGQSKTSGNRSVYHSTQPHSTQPHSASLTSSAVAGLYLDTGIMDTQLATTTIASNTSICTGTGGGASTPMSPRSRFPFSLRKRGAGGEGRAGGGETVTSTDRSVSQPHSTDPSLNQPHSTSAATPRTDRQSEKMMRSPSPHPHDHVDTLGFTSPLPGPDNLTHSTAPTVPDNLTHLTRSTAPHSIAPDENPSSIGIQLRKSETRPMMQLSEVSETCEVSGDPRPSSGRGDVSGIEAPQPVTAPEIRDGKLHIPVEVNGHTGDSGTMGGFGNYAADGMVIIAGSYSGRLRIFINLGPTVRR